MPNEWQGVLDEISNLVSDMAFKTYFENKFDFESLDENGKLTITVPSIFIKQQIESKYFDAVKDALKAANFGYQEITIIQKDKKNATVIKPKAVEVTPSESYIAARTITTGATYKPSNTHVVANNDDGKRFVVHGTGLNKKYRLDNYVVGSNNDLAVSAAQAVINDPGGRYNPYFLYGGPGLGKTHLIQAIGNEIVEKHPDMKVLYVTIEQFYHDFVESMRKKIDGFAKKYRDVDVLIVDDFQYIVGKEKSQEEFFHTFNELHQQNKQVIISSDRLPSQIAEVDERLSSRLMQGVPIDIQMPDFETRCAILQVKAEIENIEIDNRTIEYLAENFRSNIRELEGKLHQIAALAELKGVPTSALIDDGYIKTDEFVPKRKITSARNVVEKVAKFYSLSPADLLGTSRQKDIKNARQVAMYLMNEELGLSTVKIGNEFKKDHTTIMHGIKVVKANLKTDFGLREQVTELRRSIYEH